MAEKSSEEVAETPEPFRNLCPHYSRACSLVAPCCNKVYPCRICHDDVESHGIDRFAVKEVICRKCDHRQPVTDACSKCSVKFAKYFCSVCRLYDDLEKGQYHCSKCGICRIGGRDNFFHCDTCGLCLMNSIKSTHKCIQEASRSNCPVCMEDLHTSRNAAHVPKCGHLLHKACFKEMTEKGLYQCPQCQTSLMDMSASWQRLDQERQQWMLPQQLRDFVVKIQCRDCRQENDTNFHFVGFKCPSCGSYNTVRTGNESLPLDDVDPTSFLTNPDILYSSDEDREEEEEIGTYEDVLDGNYDFPLPLNEVPSTDSDEYESLSSHDNNEQLFIVYSPSSSPIPHLIEPNIDHLDHLDHLIDMHLNFNHDEVEDDDNDEDLDDEDDIILHHPLLSGGGFILNNPFHFLHNPPPDEGGSNLLDSPQIWEVTGEDDDDVVPNLIQTNGSDHSNQDVWETSSEEEIIGGNEEDLGKEILIDDEEHIHQLGDVAPAH